MHCTIEFTVFNAMLMNMITVFHCFVFIFSSGDAGFSNLLAGSLLSKHRWSSRKEFLFYEQNTHWKKKRRSNIYQDSKKVSSKVVIIVWDKQFFTFLLYIQKLTGFHIRMYKINILSSSDSKKFMFRNEGKYSVFTSTNFINKIIYFLTFQFLKIFKYFFK